MNDPLDSLTSEIVAPFDRHCEPSAEISFPSPYSDSPARSLTIGHHNKVNLPLPLRIRRSQSTSLRFQPDRTPPAEASLEDGEGCSLADVA